MNISSLCLCPSLALSFCPSSLLAASHLGTILGLAAPVADVHHPVEAVLGAEPDSGPIKPLSARGTGEGGGGGQEQHGNRPWVRAKA